jgi:hypothetical protein
MMFLFRHSLTAFLQKELQVSLMNFFCSKNVCAYEKQYQFTACAVKLMEEQFEQSLLPARVRKKMLSISVLRDNFPQIDFRSMIFKIAKITIEACQNLSLLRFIHELKLPSKTQINFLSVSFIQANDAIPKTRLRHKQRSR